jgi:uncharacterized protein (TIGR03437 family)
VSEPTLPEFFGGGSGAPATAVATPFTLTLAHQIGTAPLASVRASVTAAGGSLVLYAVVSTPKWLTVTPENGDSRTDLTATLTAAANTLAVGTHVENIVLNVPDSAQRTLTIPVRLTITKLSPTVTQITDAWSYRAGVAPGAWVTIRGKDLAASEAVWSPTGTLLPVTLNGVTVRFNGRQAALLYVGPQQINALVPSNVIPGPVTVTVQNALGTSDAFNITATPVLPAIYTVSAGGSAFVTAALAGTGTLIGNKAVDSRVLRGAQRGDLLDLYVIGAGVPLDPNPFITDRPFSAAYPIAAGTLATLDGTPMQVLFAGLTSPGLYLVRIKIPENAQAGARPLVLTFAEIATLPVLLIVE